MTRLTGNDVKSIERELHDYEAELIRKTGMTLTQIAATASGRSEKKLSEAAASSSAAVIPITAGEGIIEHFAQSVCSILRHIGCRAFVTISTDVTGMAEAVAAGARILFMADDLSFVAINLNSCAVIDNAVATGRGYVAALNGMAGGLKGEPVLVLGAGGVGCGAIAMLQELGAHPSVYDIDIDKARRVEAETGARGESDLKEALSRHRLIIDATPQPAFIGLGDLRPDAMIAAPGIPLGLTPDARLALESRLIHDPLQIGVATMLGMALNA